MNASVDDKISMELKVLDYEDNWILRGFVVFLMIFYFYIFYKILSNIE